MKNLTKTLNSIVIFKLHMETKITNNYYQVLNILENGENHSREISRKINVSHSQITKILNFFYQRGVLEKKNFGKSIIYFINRNFITKQYLVVLSKQKLIEVIIKNPKLKIIIEEIILKIGKESRNIDCVILFGSYSTGLNNKNSDIDLFFITNLKREKLNPIISSISENYGVDINIKILTKKEFVKQINHPLTREVLTGIPILNSELFYELKWLK